VQMSRVCGATRLNILCMPRHNNVSRECLSRQPRSAVDGCSTCAQPECIITIDSVKIINSSYSYGDLASFILTYSQIVFLFCLKISGHHTWSSSDSQVSRRMSDANLPRSRRTFTWHTDEFLTSNISSRLDDADSTSKSKRKRQALIILNQPITRHDTLERLWSSCKILQFLLIAYLDALAEDEIYPPYLSV
jgi:hypothetical protein